MTSRAEFERCWPWLQASLEKFGATHNQNHVWDAIRTGRAVLWPGENAVILTNVINHPIGLRSCNVWLQGGNPGSSPGQVLEELKTMHPPIEQAAREHHCDQMIAWGRDGWVRVMDGWQSCGTRRRKVLTP